MSHDNDAQSREPRRTPERVSRRHHGKRTGPAHRRRARYRVPHTEWPYLRVNGPQHPTWPGSFTLPGLLFEGATPARSVARDAEETPEDQTACRIKIRIRLHVINQRRNASSPK